MTVGLIGVDFDGTLLDPHDRVGKRTIAAVAEARARGIGVVPATGRPDRLVWDIAREVGLGPLGVCSNGAVIIDVDAGTVLLRRGFSGEQAVEIVDLIRSRLPDVALGADEGDVFSHEPSLFDGLGVPPRTGRAEVEDLRARLGGGCLKFVARCAGMSSRELAAALGPVMRLPAGADDAGARRRSVEELQATGMVPAGGRVLAELTASDIAWVDIGPAGLTKATGLAEVGRRLGVALADTAAIGDHFNDLPMLTAVGVSAAMGNAIPEVRAAADRVVATNAEDGVAEFIEDLLR